MGSLNDGISTPIESCAILCLKPTLRVFLTKQNLAKERNYEELLVAGIALSEGGFVYGRNGYVAFNKH